MNSEADKFFSAPKHPQVFLGHSSSKYDIIWAKCKVLSFYLLSSEQTIKCTGVDGKNV